MFSCLFASENPYLVVWGLEPLDRVEGKWEAKSCRTWCRWLDHTAEWQRRFRKLVLVASICLTLRVLRLWLGMPRVASQECQKDLFRAPEFQDPPCSQVARLLLFVCRGLKQIEEQKPAKFEANVG